MAAHKLMKELRSLDGVLTQRVNPYRQENLIKTSSPSMNWIFGHGHGLPFGHGVMLWGEPKSGKSLLTYDLIASLHRDYPDAIAVKFDTEYRDDSQLTEEEASLWGIDLERLVVIQKNKAAAVFDQIEQKIGALCQEGLPVRLIAIDSISGIQGRRDANADSVEQAQIGDHAQTIKVGLKRILPVQKENHIALVCSTHAAVEMDMWEQKRGNKTKAAAGYGVRHHCEYFVNVEKVLNADGKQDLQGRKLIDDSRKGMDDKGEKLGHKIKVWMQDSTVGPQDRVAQFTFDYRRGIVNQHEECFLLGSRWGVIKRPNNATYEFDGKTYRGKDALIDALAGSKELQGKVATGLLEAERTGAMGAQTPEDAEAEFKRLSEAE